MSVKTFFQKLFSGIKKELKALPQQVKDALHIGITVVDGLKKAIDSPVADILTAIIPGDWDDKAKDLLRRELPKILVEMKLVENCANQTDPNEIVKCAIRTLDQLTGDWVKDSARKKFYDSLAVLIAQAAADGKLTFDDAKYLVPFYYDNIYKPKK